MSSDLKSKTVTGFLWRLAERVGAQAVTFIVSIVLAWFIVPEDYAIISLVTIFITFCNIFVTSGFGNSLVQKKDADNLDFSSVFYFNIVFSVTVYGLLFLAAPYIGKFYDSDLLTSVIRVMGIRIIIAAVNSVQQAYVSRKMQFKRFFFSTLGGTVASGILGIVLAYFGFGVWSIVAQYLCNTIVDTVVLWFTVKWRPERHFSFERLKTLFSYGWKLLLSGIIDEGYKNIRSLVIGKVYTKDNLALYNNGQKIPDLIVDNVNSSIASVLFPAIAKKQTDREAVRRMTRRSVKIGGYVMIPLMTGLALCAEALVHVILPETWYECIPYIQISCFSGALIPLQTANLQAIKAIGRSDISLKVEIIKKVTCLLIFLSVCRVSVMAIAYSTIVTSMVSLIINSFPNAKLLGYRYIDQLIDVLPYVLMSLVMGVCVYFTGLLPVPSFAALVLQVLAGALVYVLLSVIFKIDSFKFLLESLSGFMGKFKKSK
ncbi:MAG: lipopolysaccharide biosynthesis protein [Ruminococcaceae bacterium]|nr:lipopolysaccharide biosynthesis protein [Oscillospiraceae bacterium]